MGKRKQEIEETRRRIVEAAVELHGSVGPAGTTISGVAERAGVQRSTVYRHFEDEQALFGACTSHWLARHPWPRPDAWRERADPKERLGRALAELYGYYDANRDMLGNSYRDIDIAPPFVGEMMREIVAEIHRTLAEPWTGVLPEQWHQVAIGHAVDFRTWQTLDSLGVPADEAAELMTAMVSGLAMGGSS
jgi:AcrR family transcriptional regulator